MSYQSKMAARLGAGALALGMLAAPVLAQRQAVPRGDNGKGPPIARLEITVEDMGSGRFLPSIAPKDVLQIGIGQQVRLRMTALPANDNRSPRYPSTRFDPNPGQRFLSIDKVNPEVGSIIVTGRQAHGANGAVPIEYQILDDLQMRDELRSGRIYVKVVAPVRPPEPPPSRPPEPPPSRPPSSRGGVTFYQDEDFRGRSQTFYDSDDRLADNPIGNDTISSVRVDRGCRVYLYGDERFRGRVTVLDGDSSSLRGSEVGNDSVSSFRLECRGDGGGGGNGPRVTLYADADFRGDAEAFFGDDSNLQDNRLVGNDRASSIRVDRGCEAWLFEDANFNGRSLYVTDDIADLGRTVLGNDRVSSIRVSCRRR